MIKVYFEDENLKRTFINEAESFDDAMKVISGDIKKHNIKSYYYNIWKQCPTEVIVDYGSHSCFYIVEVPEDFTFAAVQDSLKMQ